jgi:hypothetical protein
VGGVCVIGWAICDLIRGKGGPGYRLTEGHARIKICLLIPMLLGFMSM